MKKKNFYLAPVLLLGCLGCTESDGLVDEQVANPQEQVVRGGEIRQSPFVGSCLFFEEIAAVTNDGTKEVIYRCDMGEDEIGEALQKYFGFAGVSYWPSFRVLNDSVVRQYFSNTASRDLLYDDTAVEREGNAIRVRVMPWPDTCSFTIDSVGNDRLYLSGDTWMRGNPAWDAPRYSYVLAVCDIPNEENAKWCKDM